MGEVGQTLQPPLSARLRPAHWLALDCFIAAAYAGLLAVWFLPRVTRDRAPLPVGVVGLPVWLDWIVVLLITVPVALRRRSPLPALGLAAASTILGSVGGFRQAPFPALAYVLYYIALTRPRPISIAGLALAEASALAAFAAGSDLTALSPTGGATALPALLFTLMTQVATWLIGRTVAQQRAYSRGLAEHAAARSAAEIDAARAAITAQRLQMARDLHDVVAHSVSLMTVQAGAARMLADTEPGETRQLLAAIETTGRECLRETRHVLGVLREEDQPSTGLGSVHGDAAELGPAPSLDELPTLVARSTAAGLKVVITTHGTPPDLPPSIDLTAYRIIQEALTNVMRHSTADRCQLSLSYGPREMSIRVTNPLFGPRKAPHRPPGTGHGLIGMRERVALHGGTFSASAALKKSFTLTASLPYPEATQ